MLENPNFDILAYMMTTGYLNILLLISKHITKRLRSFFFGGRGGG